jgi:hypothetical protein
MEEDIKILEELIKAAKDYNQYEGNKYYKSIENLIKGYKELQEHSDDLLSQNEMFKDMYDEEIYKNKKLEEEKESLLWQRNTIDIPKIEELQEENRNIKNHIYYKEVVELNYIPKSALQELIKNKAHTDTYNFKTIAVKDIEELLQEGDDK